MAWQTWQAWRGLATPLLPVPTAAASAAPERPIDPALLRLFGTPSDHAATLPDMQLRATFVATDATASSAVIALTDGHTRRVAIGDEVLPGIRLRAVASHQITLARDEQAYTISFAPPRSTATPTGIPQP